MKRKINPFGVICAVIALIYLGAMIFAGATHQFFWFVFFAGLAYALLTEDPDESKEARR